MGLRKYMFSCGHCFFKQRLQREGGWVPLYCGLRVFLLSCNGGMIQLPWDPDRYDYISIHFFFLATWNIWDHSLSGHFVEVRCFAFLNRGDLQTVCCACYGIYIDSQDILLRLDDYRQSEPE